MARVRNKCQWSIVGYDFIAPTFSIGRHEVSPNSHPPLSIPLIHKTSPRRHCPTCGCAEYIPHPNSQSFKYQSSSFKMPYPDMFEGYMIKDQSKWSDFEKKEVSNDEINRLTSTHA